MNLGAAIIAAALFKSQIKALVNGDVDLNNDDVIIGPPEPPPPRPVCPSGLIWDENKGYCVAAPTR